MEAREMVKVNMVSVMHLPQSDAEKDSTEKDTIMYPKPDDS
jgi:hypothetical protein